MLIQKKNDILCYPTISDIKVVLSFSAANQIVCFDFPM